VGNTLSRKADYIKPIFDAAVGSAVSEEKVGRMYAALNRGLVKHAVTRYLVEADRDIFAGVLLGIVEGLPLEDRANFFAGLCARQLEAVEDDWRAVLGRAQEGPIVAQDLMGRLALPELGVNLRIQELIEAGYLEGKEEGGRIVYEVTQEGREVYAAGGPYHGPVEVSIQKRGNQQVTLSLSQSEEPS